MTALTLPKTKGEPMPNVLAERIHKKHPKQSNFYEAFRYMISVDASEDEMTNVMLIAEKVLIEKPLGLLLKRLDIVDLAQAVIGLGAKYLTEQQPVPVISTREQLDSDTSVAAFIVRYGLQYSPPAGSNYFNHDRRLLHSIDVRRGKRNRTITTFSNLHIEGLLRECPESHDLIGYYVTERGLANDSEEAVIELRNYLSQAQNSPALHTGWL